MPDIPAGGPPPVPIEFGSLEWEEEVERYGPRSAARAQAQSARKTIEVGTAKLDWKRCRAEGPRRTELLEGVTRPDCSRGGRVHLIGAARPRSHSVGPFSAAIAKV